jgi:hypothetical protein
MPGRSYFVLSNFILILVILYSIHSPFAYAYKILSVIIFYAATRASVCLEYAGILEVRENYVALKTIFELYPQTVHSHFLAIEMREFYYSNALCVNFN